MAGWMDTPAWQGAWRLNLRDFDDMNEFARRR